MRSRLYAARASWLGVLRAVEVGSAEDGTHFTRLSVQKWWLGHIQCAFVNAAAAVRDIILQDERSLPWRRIQSSGAEEWRTAPGAIHFAYSQTKQMVAYRVVRVFVERLGLPRNY